MKIYMSNDNQYEMATMIFGLCQDLNDEDPLKIFINTILTDKTKEVLKALPPRILNISTIYTPYIENIMEDTDFTQYMIEFRADMWKEQCDKLSSMEYYHGLPIIFNLDSFAQKYEEVKDTDPDFTELVDMLIYFYETCGLYRKNCILLDIGNSDVHTSPSVEFFIYNTIVAFMSREMENVCFWNKIGVPPENRELFGLPESRPCSMHCVDGGLIDVNGVYFCENRRVKICELSEIGTAEHRKKLFKYYKEHMNEGCVNLK